MSDARMDKLDDRLREVEKVLFNGLSDTSRKMNAWLDDQAPELLTRGEHERLDEARWEKSTERNREIGRKKDRMIKILAILVPLTTAGLMKLVNML